MYIYGAPCSSIVFIMHTYRSTICYMYFYYIYYRLWAGTINSIYTTAIYTHSILVLHIAYILTLYIYHTAYRLLCILRTIYASWTFLGVISRPAANDIIYNYICIYSSCFLVSAVVAINTSRPVGSIVASRGVYVAV